MASRVAKATQDSASVTQSSPAARMSVTSRSLTHDPVWIAPAAAGYEVRLKSPLPNSNLHSTERSQRPQSRQKNLTQRRKDAKIKTTTADERRYTRIGALWRAVLLPPSLKLWRTSARPMREAL
jgi:hypothetical protein